MALEVTLSEDAEKDISEAYAWYEERRIGLGEDFLSCLDASLQGIKRMPEMHPIVYQSFRRALIRRFPYASFYEIEGERITVSGVFHTARDPQKWRQRLG